MEVFLLRGTRSAWIVFLIERVKPAFSGVDPLSVAPLAVFGSNGLLDFAPKSNVRLFPCSASFLCRTLRLSVSEEELFPEERSAAVISC